MDNKICLKKEQIEILSEKTPDIFVEINEGHKYIPTPIITQKLNDIFGYVWSWEILGQWIEECRSFVNARGEKQNNGESFYAVVHGRLSYPVVDNSGKITMFYKDAFGCKPVIGKVKIQSSSYKAAASDALKKAASLLGIGRDLKISSRAMEHIYKGEQDSFNPNDIAQKEKSNLLVNYIKEVGPEKAKEAILDFCKNTGNYKKFGVIGPSNIDNFFKYLREKGVRE